MVIVTSCGGVVNNYHQGSTLLTLAHLHNDHWVCDVNDKIYISYIHVCTCTFMYVCVYNIIITLGCDCSLVGSVERGGMDTTGTDPGG